MANEQSSKVVLIEGMHFRGINVAGHQVEIDSRPAGEPTAGTKPTELLLQAVGACSGMDVVFVLRKRKLEPEALEIVVSGKRREEHPKSFENMHVTYKVRGAGITLEELKRAVDLSFEKYCSVIGTLRKGIEITYSCELLG